MFATCVAFQVGLAELDLERSLPLSCPITAPSHFFSYSLLPASSPAFIHKNQPPGLFREVSVS